MVREFFRFELREQLRSPLLWLLAGMFGLMAFAAASSDAVQIGGGIGNVFRNAPVVMVRFMAAFTVLGMLVIGVFVGNALLRDFEVGIADLVFSSPIRKRDFLVGRFGAALAASLLVYLVIATFLFVAQFMPWIDPERLGPASLAPFGWAFAVVVLPNVLFTGALLALMAVATRSILWVYIGILGFLVLYVVSGALASQLDNVWLATLIDPFGQRAIARSIRYWSIQEQNTGLPALSDYLLVNRLFWVAMSLAIAGLAFRLFKTERTGTGRAWFRRSAKAPASAPAAPAAAVPAPPPRRAPAFGAGTTLRQFLRLVRFDAAGVFRSVPFLVMLAFGMVNFIPAALLAKTLYETPIHPVTSQMLQTLNGTYSFLLVIIALFYAGELVWKERAAKLGEVTDALPVPDWVPLAAKFTALVMVVACFQALGGATAVALQLAKGHTLLEPLVALRILAVNAVPFILMGGLALVLQVYTNHKFIGYGLLILALAAQATLGLMDFTHNLYLYGSAPNAPYSDMNGYGHFLVAQGWFQAYWSLLLAALLVLASAFWVRGVAPAGRERLRKAAARLSGRTGLAFGALLLVWAGTGAFIYYNTNVLNRFLSPAGLMDLQARYEREFKQYADTPQPRILAAALQVDLRPETQDGRITGEFRVTNPHDAPLREVHVQMLDDRSLAAIDFGGSELVSHDAGVGYRIYRLDRPLAPGEQRVVSFTVELGEPGFTNFGSQSQLVENGTFFNSSLLPSFGYNPDAELQDRNERRKRGLGEPRRMPLLEDEAARANTYIGDDADWIEFSATVCTAPDQVALAPGYLRREFTRDGRRCFDYAMDRPMLNFYAFLSGRWEKRTGHYKDLPIEVYYDPRHAYNVDRMIEAVQKSLAYYEANFSPYQHQQVRIIEFPGYARFAQSFANTIPYSEDIGFIADLSDPDEIDYVFYVTAHEVAHQWWAHQVIGANVQGATVLSESLSQYSALMVLEKEYGRDKMRKFLKYELDRYLSDRGGERVEELPLYRVENQQYIHYRKGSMVFYRLREEMGEAAVNRALAAFIRDKAFQTAPFTTTRELIDYLRAEAGPAQQQLITDLFEKISFYDNRVVSAEATPLADGRYEVTLALHADKRYSDGKGKETPAPMDDWIEVGVFAGRDDADQEVLYLQRHHVTEANPTVTVVVDKRPTEAGFDPNNKLIDRVSGDNRRQVVVRD